VRAGCDGARGVVALLVVARAAVADPTRADETFARGRELMQQKRYAEACTAFEQSQRLDPAAGTLFNLADCEAHLGKLATAWALYVELGRTDSNRDRRALSAQLAAQLAPRVPKLVIEIAKAPPGLTLALDGVDSTGLIGVEIPVDLGAHAIVVTAPGYREQTTRPEVREEGRVTHLRLHLDPVASEPASPPQPAVTEVAPRPAGHGQGTAGEIAVFGGAGLAAIGLGVGALAYSTWDHATSCTGCDRPTLVHDARIEADISTALVIAGVAAAGAGLYLWHTSSSSAALAPGVGPDRVGLAIAGRF